MDSSAYDNDATLVQLCLNGDANAQEYFANTFSELLVDHLKSRGAEHSDALSATNDFLNECLFKYTNKSNQEKPPRLERYKPDSPLLAWLRKSVAFYFIDSRRKLKKELPLIDPQPTENIAGPSISPASGASDLVADALRHALQSVSPENYVLTFLFLFHGVKQGTLADILGYSASKLSRKIGACLQDLQSHTLDYIKKIDPHFQLNWDDLLAIADDFFKDHSETEPNPSNKETANQVDSSDGDSSNETPEGQTRLYDLSDDDSIGDSDSERK